MPDDSESGTRFRRLSRKLKGEGAYDPDALAAYIGRKKYGKGRFQQMAAEGRRRQEARKAAE